MNHSRRGFIKWSAGAWALAALKPSRLWADTANPFAGFDLAAAGKFKTRPSSAIGASPLSVGYETLDRRHFDPVKTYRHAAQLGVKWARCQTGWARTEKARGQYDFDWLDEVVDGLIKIGIQPWFNLGYGNPLYTPKPAFFAYQNLGALFDAETRKADLPVRVEGAGETTVVTASFQRRGQPLYLFWMPVDLTKDVPPQKVKVTVGDKLKSPALLDPLTGAIYRITSLAALPLADYPLIIADETAFQTGD